MVKEIPSTLKDVRGNKSKWPLFDIVFSRKKTPLPSGTCSTVREGWSVRESGPDEIN